MSNSNVNSDKEKNTIPEVQNDAKQVFKNCGTCSQTFAHLLNREYGYINKEHERAMDPMAGGLMNQGYQCGMLWGAALAIGAESYRKYKDLDKATAVAITASQHILKSFTKKTNTLNCKEIIGIDLSKMFGMFKFIIKTSVQGANKNPCYNLAEQWAPDAIKSATKGLSQEPVELAESAISCASLVVKQMGASDEEITMVAGFAGGLGLSGGACGALSAAIWMKTLNWCREHPGKNPPYFNNKSAKKVLYAFYETTEAEILCTKISGRTFKTIDDHSKYIKNGGCKNLINVLSQV